MTQKTWLIDIGNSTIAYCEKNNTKLTPICQLSTEQFDTQKKKLPFNPKDTLIISSVVPSLNHYFIQYPNTHFLNHSSIKDIQINIKHPEEVGADRLANALGAFKQFNTACIIIDSGTALTFCYIDHKGTYQGGSILPGLGIATKALYDYTAKIPLIPISAQKHIYGKTTKNAVQSGIYHGYFYLISGLISEYKKIIPNSITIGTGTGLDIYNTQIKLDYYLPSLIFTGLSYFEASINKKNK